MVSHWTLGFAQLRRCIPEMFALGSCLYVGASRDKFAHGARELMRAGRMITILEIWEPNVAYYRGHPEIARVVQGDVRDVMTLKLGHFDLVFWWHGPEHILAQDLEATLAGLESVGDLIVLGCPFGLTAQREEEMRGNPHQKHVSGYLPADFARLGYRTDTFGKEAQWNASNLLAWKRVR